MTPKKADREHQKSMVLLIGSLAIVVLCLLGVIFLIYQSLVLEKSIPEYALAIFSSIATLVIGYLFGKDKGG